MGSDEKEGPRFAVGGVIPYGLADSGLWCEECGRPKLDRLFGLLSDCGTCNEAITRHRCTKRPDLEAGQSWACPDCGTAWTAGEEEETCPECGHGLGTMRRTWDSVPGDRIDTAPKYTPQPWTPLRNALRGTVDALYARREPVPLGSCYTMGNGSVVHVRPGCRCPRR